MTQEVSTPLLVDPDQDFINTTDLLVERCEQHSDHPAFEVPDRDAAGTITAWRQVTTAEFAADVRVRAKALIAAGVRPGDCVAIMAGTSYDWAVTDLAVMFAGGVVVPIYDTSSDAQIAAICRDAGARFAFAGNTAQAASLTAALHEIGNSIGVVCFASPDSLGSFQAASSGVPDATVETRRRSRTLDDTATIVYTSGTTGDPKGVVITHRNLVGQVLNVKAAYSEIVNDAGSTVIFLPLAHVLARGLQFACLTGGMRVAHLADPAELVAELPRLKPTFLVLVPRVLEKIRDRITAQAAGKKLLRLWRQAAGTAVREGRLKQSSSSATIRHRFLYRVYDRLFYSRVRKLFGGRLNYALSGGAKLEAELAWLFAGMGVPVIEGYGLTETTAPITGNLPGNSRAGTVGVPIPGATVRIAADGEVQVRGIGVCSGYTSPELTAANFTADGFFRTGDLGVLEDGFLRLKGRLKDDIVTSNGKSVSPFAWESEMLKSPLVAHAVAVGEGRNFLAALLVPDREAVTERRLTGQQLHDAIAAAVAAANSLVARSEQIKKFLIVDVDPDDPQFVTPTQKLKRQVFTTHWKDAIASLFNQR